MNKNENAYDDLLNTIDKDSDSASEKKSSGGFKVNIEGLDREFNTSSAARTQVYKRSEAAPKLRNNPMGEKRTQSRPVSRNNTTSVNPASRSSAQTQTKKSALGSNKEPAGTYAPIRQNNANISKKNNLKGKKKAPKKKFDFKAFFKKSKNAIIILAICIAVSVAISSYAISCMNDILAINRDSENIVTVNVPNAVDTKQAIEILKDNGLIKHKYFCMIFAKIVEYRDDNYLTGIYYLTPSMGLENMLSAFKETPISGETVTLTFPEGYTVMQIAEKLEKNEVCSAQAFYATIRDVDFSSEYGFVNQEDRKSERFQLLEGYLYPDTYEFYVGENASSVVRKFLDNFKEKWTDKYEKQAKKINMSIDDVITLASLIEKEAYGKEQMPLVSSVFHNRLNKPGIYPTLQSNATSDYVNEYISKSVTDSSTLTRYMKDYSTYKCEGLPVGAICNPGDDAINAALFPADTNYYYFLHDNNKKIYLASTDAEHRANGIAALRANSSENS